jgi:hypothetical protein
MKQIIYSKYSNYRKEPFRIKTAICQDENNRLVVEKVALNKNALCHVQNIYNNYKYLKEHNHSPEININKCDIKNDMLQFEYIKGIRLTEKLNQLVKENKYIQFIEEIKSYIDIIRELHGITSFTITDEFVEIFGENSFPPSVEAVIKPNVDLIFDNILINDQINIIDYEWLFDFPIPLNYILYRSLNQYFEQIDDNKLHKEINIFAILNISKEELEKFHNMEVNFSKYVMMNYLDNYKKGYVPLVEILEPRGVNRGSSQIFFDFGEGFTEENSCAIAHEFCKDQSINLRIPINGDMKSIRVDPCESRCIVTVISLTIVEENESNELEYITNCYLKKSNTHLFFDSDPQMIIQGIQAKGKGYINIKFKLSILDEQEALFISQLIDETKMVEDIGYQLDEEREKISGLTRELDEEKEKISRLISELDEEKQKVSGLARKVDEQKEAITQLNCKLLEEKIVANKFKNELDIQKDKVNSLDMELYEEKNKTLYTRVKEKIRRM